MRRGLIFAVSLLAGAGVLGLGGCARFHDQPLSAEKSRADLEARTLADRRLKSFLETNLRTQSASWPLPSWNFTNLSRAAFYFHPDLDVARAQLVGAKAAGVTAGAKPNPTVSLTPIYDTTTGPPWILGLSIDVPIETMGKRGYRIAQAVHLSDAARFNLASTAWQVRSRVRKSLLALYAAGESESLLKKQEAITAEIPLANFPKQFEVEGNLIYVNVPAANHVAIVGRKEKTVVATWPVTAAKDNIPMGFDRARHRLFIGCVPGKLAVLDSTNGRQVAALEIAPDPDGVHYDAKRRCIYISCGDGSIDVVRQIDAGRYEFAQRVRTVKGAATSLFVPEPDQLFLGVPQRDGQTAELRVYSVNPK